MPTVSWQSAHPWTTDISSCESTECGREKDGSQLVTNVDGTGHSHIDPLFVGVAKGESVGGVIVRKGRFILPICGGPPPGPKMTECGPA